MFRVARQIGEGSKFLVETYGSTTRWNETPTRVLTQEVSAEHEIPESERIPVFRGEEGILEYLADYALKTSGSLYEVVDQDGDFCSPLQAVANTMLVRAKGPVVKRELPKPMWYELDKRLFDELSVSLGKRILQKGHTISALANSAVNFAAATIAVAAFLAYIARADVLILLMAFLGFIWGALDRTLDILQDHYLVRVSGNAHKDRLLGAKLASASFLVVAPLSGSLVAALMLASDKHLTFIDKALVEFLSRNYVLAMSWNLLVYWLLGASAWPCLFGILFLWISCASTC